MLSPAAANTGTGAGVLNRAEFGVFLTRIPLKQVQGLGSRV